MKSIVTLLVLAAGVFSCQKQITEVTLCSAIHGAHKSNMNFSYDHLFAFIEEQQPDVIGVEIRPEDMDLPDSVLAKYYPFEMRDIVLRYPHRPVLGFDWLGKEIEGRPIYPTYFEEMEITKLENQLGEDSIMTHALMAMDEVRNAKIELVLNGSLQGLNDGVYDSLNTEYYEKMATIFRNTPYAALIDFYRERDAHIAENIIRIIHRYPGKRLLFVMGGDHRSFVIDAVKNAPGDEIVLNKVFDNGP